MRNSEKSRVLFRMGQIGRERGENSERTVARILREKLEAGELPEWMLGCKRASRNGEKNRRGIDFEIMTDVGKVPLQVKSSVTGAQEFLEKHPEIPVVVIRSYDTDEANLHRVMEAIKPFYDFYAAIRRGNSECNGWRGEDELSSSL